MTQRKTINNYMLSSTLLLLAMLVIWGCSPTRRLKPNEKLLNKVYIEKDKKEISESDIRGYLRQKPNRKLIGFWRFYLQIYNLVDPEKAVRDHTRRLTKKKARIDNRDARRNVRCLKKEARKKLHGKKFECKKHSRTDAIEAKSFREWVQGIGEEPAVYDSTLSPISAEQIKQYLFNKGYFFATVKDSTVAVTDKKVNTYYKIKSGKQYTALSIKYETPDSTIKNLITIAKEEKFVTDNKPFDADAIGKERDRLTKFLKNKGYFFFNNEFITVEVDTANKNNTCKVVFNIKNPRVAISGIADSSIESTHKIYHIHNIIVNTQYAASRSNYSSYNTKEYNNVTFLYPDSNNLFRPKAIYNHIAITEGEVYSDTKLDYTLSRLGDLRVFKFINVKFVPTDTTAENAQLDCYILLTPSMRRSFSAETQGTNTGGNLGIGGSVSFINKNLFKGAEYFEFKIKGALEAQRLVNDEISTDGRNSLFNTQELGASLTLNIPSGIFPINYFVRKQSRNVRSQITTLYNFQQRPQYRRNLYSLTFGWNWKQNRRMNITYNPIEINYIQATLNTEFADLLAKSSPVLRSSFDPTMIENGRVSITWSNQQTGKRKNYIFWRIGAESAGLLLNSFLKRDSIFGVKSAQFARIDFEIYPNIYLNDKNAFAFRGYLGVGTAYANNKAIPFARAFFAGGSNGMRAWIQRSLGPGIYDKSDTTNQIDQVGDIKLELNAEYRLKLFSFFETALFVDAGNVWLARPDNGRPGAEITPQFYKQIAVGYGIGLRLDLSFFLLRLDFARRLYDPGAQYNEKFLSPFEYKRYTPIGSNQPRRSNPVIFNLGIGYPF